MTKSLYKVLFLTVATTALSIIPTFAGEESLKGPSATATHPVAEKPHHDLLKEMHAEWEKVEGGLKDAFSPAHLAAFQKLLNQAAGVVEVGLSVAAAADPKNTTFQKAAAGIGAGVGVVNAVAADLTQPGGVTAASATQALQDAAKGMGTVASVSAPGSKAAAQVTRIADETSDVTAALLPGGKLTAASALSAGAAIASDVGGKGGTTAAAVLTAVSAAEQAQQGVQTAVNSANPLPPASSSAPVVPTTSA